VSFERNLVQCENSPELRTAREMAGDRCSRRRAFVARKFGRIDIVLELASGLGNKLVAPKDNDD
jgi:hypothetical protein